MRSRNNTVYTGKVGAKMKPPTVPKAKKCSKYRYMCMDGPMKGYALFLTYGGTTAVMNVAGQIGRYVAGKWEAA